MEYCVPLPPWFGNTEPTFANTEETEMSLRPQINCHTISGTVAHGRFGRDLTHLMSRETLRAGAATNTHKNLRAWIQDSDSTKPRSLMPAMKVNV